MLTQAFTPLFQSVCQLANSICLAIGVGNTTTALPAGWLGSSNQVRIYNSSTTAIAFINFGKTQAEAAAAIPIVGTPAAGFAVAPNEDMTISVPPQAAFIGVIGSVANGFLYVSCGEGV